MRFFSTEHSRLYTTNVSRSAIHPPKTIQNELNQKNHIPQRSRQLQQLLNELLGHLYNQRRHVFDRQSVA